MDSMGSPAKSPMIMSPLLHWKRGGQSHTPTLEEEAKRARNGIRRLLVQTEKGHGRIYRSVLAISLDNSTPIRVYYSSIQAQQVPLQLGMPSIASLISIREPSYAFPFWMSLIVSWIAHSLFQMLIMKSLETQ